MSGYATGAGALRLVVAVLVVGGATLSPASTARARRAYGSALPALVDADGAFCITCHNNAGGGSGCSGATGSSTNPYGHCWNVFGRDFGEPSLANKVRSTWLQNRDSDGDRFSNAQELSNHANGGVLAPGNGSSVPCNTCDSRPNVCRVARENL